MCKVQRRKVDLHVEEFQRQLTMQEIHRFIIINYYFYMWFLAILL
jgi:hypothetical protein